MPPLRPDPPHPPPGRRRDFASTPYAPAPAPAPGTPAPPHRPPPPARPRPGRHPAPWCSARPPAPATRHRRPVRPPRPLAPRGRRPDLQLRTAVGTPYRNHRTGPRQHRHPRQRRVHHHLPRTLVRRAGGRVVPPPPRQPHRTPDAAAVEDRRHQQTVAEQEGVLAVPQGPVLRRAPPDRPHIRGAGQPGHMRQRHEVRVQPLPFQQRRPRVLQSLRTELLAPCARHRSPSACAAAAGNTPFAAGADTARGRGCRRSRPHRGPSTAPRTAQAPAPARATPAAQATPSSHRPTTYPRTAASPPTPTARTETAAHRGAAPAAPRNRPAPSPDRRRCGPRGDRPRGPPDRAGPTAAAWDPRTGPWRPAHSCRARNRRSPARAAPRTGRPTSHAPAEP